MKRSNEVSVMMGPYHEEAGIYARACILFVWSAVEGIVLHEVRRIRKSGQKRQFPKSLIGKVQLLMSDRNVAFDATLFERLRNYRSVIAHPPNAPTYTSPPPGCAQEHFNYCVSLCEALYSSELKFQKW